MNECMYEETEDPEVTHLAGIGGHEIVLRGETPTIGGQLERA